MANPLLAISMAPSLHKQRRASGGPIFSTLEQRILKWTPETNLSAEDAQGRGNICARLVQNQAKEDQKSAIRPVDIWPV